ncbi:hypothetical protein B296_00021521 [Ensete ventricosum]|uniref:PGG domain-containing protein n=1 Tax=Ensete ventricosum TaxID=4639 RepID=A0A426Z9A8_ENSVE|nr:hypothetical protein B296_00021521 [Ensete ventricosum]
MVHGKARQDPPRDNTKFISSEQATSRDHSNRYCWAKRWDPRSWGDEGGCARRVADSLGSFCGDKIELHNYARRRPSLRHFTLSRKEVSSERSPCRFSLVRRGPEEEEKDGADDDDGASNRQRFLSQSPFVYYLALIRLLICLFLDEGGERDLESGLARVSPSPRSSSPIRALSLSLSGKRMDQEAAASPSVSAPATPALVLSNSGKRMDQAASPSLVLSNSGKRMDSLGKKKFVKQVTGRHNDTELHLAAQRGDLAAVRQILSEIDAQMTGTAMGADFDADLAEIRAAVVNDVNEVDETPLFTAAEKGFLDVVVELLKYSDRDSLTRKNRSGFDDASLIELSKNNGKNALHFAARQGYVEIVKALLGKDPQLARRTDKKGQTALHMAVKGTSSEVVKALVDADPAIVMLPDRAGNTALHVATRKKRAEIVNLLLLLPDTNVNALTRDHKTAFDIVEGLPLSEESADIKECLSRCGACRANELNQPRDELRKTVTEIKKDVHIQLEQTRKTNKNVHGIAKELRKLHREGINNATNSVTVVAVLFATVAFAAIFTVPGGTQDSGVAVVVQKGSFKVFFIFNAIALFTSLAVVVVQITLVRGETKAERRVVEIINKLMWLASVCTTVAFIASSYIVVGRHFRWAAILVTLIGGVIMAGVLGTMTFYVVKSKRTRSIRKREKSMRRSASSSWHHNSEFSDSEIDRIYAI